MKDNVFSIGSTDEEPEITFDLELPPLVSSDHTKLSNRDAADQHPISAITNLQSTLDVKLTDAPSDGKTYGRKDAAWVETSGGGVTVHNDLTGRDADDAHPLSAITGLVAALADKLGISHNTDASAHSTLFGAKQDTISDLDTIRSGASAGATAAQPSDVTSAVSTHNSASDAHSTLFSAKQDTISDIDTIRDGAAKGETAAQPADVTSAVSTHNSATDAHSSLFAAKQDTISDLDTIRSGAAAGATAAQPSSVTSAISTHNSATDTHTSLFAVKQNKYTITPTSDTTITLAEDITTVISGTPTAVNVTLPVATANKEYECGVIFKAGASCTFAETVPSGYVIEYAEDDVPVIQEGVVYEILYRCLWIEDASSNVIISAKYATV